MFFAYPFLPALGQVLIFGGFVLELFVYAMTYGPIMWMWVAEALQPSQIGYAAMASWGGAALVLILFPIVQQRLENQGFIFLFFAFFALSSLLVTNKLMLETRQEGLRNSRGVRKIRY